MNPSMLFSAGLLIAVSALAFLPELPADAQAEPPRTVNLWTGEAPGAKGKEAADIPGVTIYSPPAEKANGAAVVICPGGGYGGLAGHEGKPPAEWLNTLGVTGIVLKYRLGPRYQ